MGQKNFHKVPAPIRVKITNSAVNDFVVAAAVPISPAETRRYQHLGLKSKGDSLNTPFSVVPPAESGRYSRANREGRDVKRRDLPKTTKTIARESPNWGDWSKGSHAVYQTIEVYERDFIPPKELEISVEIIRPASADRDALVKFSVDQVLSKGDPDFENDLLYALNLLQENIGRADVFPSSTTAEEYAQTIVVDWEILPPGKITDVMAKVLRGKHAITPDQARVMRERLTMIAKLDPKGYIVGANKFIRYFGAICEDDLIVFENLRYGNAIYIMYEDWEELSKRSRTDLLKGRRDDFERIEHYPGWEDRLAFLVRDYREGGE